MIYFTQLKSWVFFLTKFIPKKIIFKVIDKVNIASKNEANLFYKEEI